MPNNKLFFAMATHRGLRRARNEDAIGYHYPSEFEALAERGALFVIADGVGGLPDGDKASRYTIHRLIQLYYNSPLTLDCHDALVSSIEQINDEVLHKFEKNMATTLVAVVVHQSTVISAHVGDSRLYWFNGEETIQHTADHSITILNEFNQPKPHLTRAIGHQSKIQVETDTQPISQGEGLLLVTDGATAYLNAGDLQSLMNSTAQEIVEDIVHYSLQGGGHDNVSAIMIFVGDELADAQALATHLQALDELGIVISIPEALQRNFISADPKERHWRMFVLTVVLLVSIIMGLLLYVNEFNERTFSNITQIPAASPLESPTPNP